MSDDLFRLGWLLDDASSTLASNCLKILCGKAAQYIPDTKAGVFMLDTQAIFVETLLRGLGWDTLDPYQVDRNPPGEYPDIELYDKDRQGTLKRLAIIEVKPLRRAEGWQHVRVQGRSAYEQLKEYAVKRLIEPECAAAPNGAPILCGIATSGPCWVVYDFDRSIEHLDPSQHTPLCEFDVCSPSAPGLIGHVDRNGLLKRFGLL